MKTLLRYPLLLAVFVSAILFSGCSDDIDDNIKRIDADDVLKTESYTFKQLEMVTNDGETPLEEITCIDFTYPITVYIYDENLQQIGSELMQNDTDFSNFLGGISDEQAISISYPISTILGDGTSYTVNSNSELKVAVDNCSQEEIIEYCNGIFAPIMTETDRCSWKVLYEPGADNSYVGAIIEPLPNGELLFHFNGTTYDGTWAFLFVDEEFHININLEGDSDVAQDWSIDRPIQIQGQLFIINDPNPNYVLSRSCSPDTDYEIGDTGPAGGIVFYDKGFYGEGWRYMEVAPWDAAGTFEWGCSGSVAGTGSESEIGTGMFASGVIAKLHDAMDSYYTNPSVCNSLNNGTVAAQEALLYGFAGFSDGFLPSADELDLVYQNLHMQNLGSLAGTYWTSTEQDAEHAIVKNFGNGNNEIMQKIPTAPVKVRVIRYF